MKQEIKQQGGKKASVSAAEETLGSRLKAQRLARKLTMDALSRLAGVSKAMLSQIEKDKVNPTVGVMLRISEALKVSIAELVQSGSPGSIFRVIHASDERYTFSTDAQCSIRTLTPLSLEKSLEFYRVTLERGGELQSEPHFPGTEEFLHLAKGTLAVTSGPETMSIAHGDSLHYRADLAHCLKNVGRGRAEAYLVVRYCLP